jgi:hypothetical protein
MIHAGIFRFFLTALVFICLNLSRSWFMGEFGCSLAQAEAAASDCCWRLLLLLLPQFAMLAVAQSIRSLG